MDKVSKFFLTILAFLLLVGVGVVMYTLPEYYLVDAQRSDEVERTVADTTGVFVLVALRLPAGMEPISAHAYIETKRREWEKSHPQCEFVKAERIGELHILHFQRKGDTQQP